MYFLMNQVAFSNYIYPSSETTANCSDNELMFFVLSFSFLNQLKNFSKYLEDVSKSDCFGGIYSDEEHTDASDLLILAIRHKYPRFTGLHCGLLRSSRSDAKLLYCTKPNKTHFIYVVTFF